MLKTTMPAQKMNYAKMKMSLNLTQKTKMSKIAKQTIMMMQTNKTRCCLRLKTTAKMTVMPDRKTKMKYLNFPGREGSWLEHGRVPRNQEDSSAQEPSDRSEPIAGTETSLAGSSPRTRG